MYPTSNPPQNAQIKYMLTTYWAVQFGKLQIGTSIDFNGI
jgi:hypothetical protein